MFIDVIIPVAKDENFEAILAACLFFTLPFLRAASHQYFLQLLIPFHSTVPKLKQNFITSLFR